VGNGLQFAVACGHASSTAPLTSSCAPAAKGSDLGRDRERVSTAPSDQAVPLPGITAQGSAANGLLVIFYQQPGDTAKSKHTAASMRQRKSCWRNMKPRNAIVVMGSVASITEVIPEGNIAPPRKGLHR